VRVPGGEDLVGGGGGEAPPPAAVRIHDPEIEAPTLLRERRVDDLPGIRTPGRLVLDAGVVGEGHGVLAVGVGHPDVARAVQLRDEQQLSSVGGDARMVLVLRAVRQLPLSRAVGADLPDVACREIALLCLFAARVEYELVSAREPGGHRVRARARDEDLGAPTSAARTGSAAASVAARPSPKPRPPLIQATLAGRAAFENPPTESPSG